MVYIVGTKNSYQNRIELVQSTLDMLFTASASVGGPARLWACADASDSFG